MRILQLITKEAIVNLNHAQSFSTVVPEGQLPYSIDYIREMNCFKIVSSRGQIVYIPMGAIKEFVVEEDKPTKRQAA